MPPAPLHSRVLGRGNPPPPPAWGGPGQTHRISVFSRGGSLFWELSWLHPHPWGAHILAPSLLPTRIPASLGGGGL